MLINICFLQNIQATFAAIAKWLLFYKVRENSIK
jgi:hypothetical protein